MQMLVGRRGGGAGRQGAAMFAQLALAPRASSCLPTKPAQQGRANQFGEEWVDSMMRCQKVSVAARPKVVPGAGRRDSSGGGGAQAGGDPARPVGTTSAAFRPARDRWHAR